MGLIKALSLVIPRRLYLQGFSTIPGGDRRIFSMNSMSVCVCVCCDYKQTTKGEQVNCIITYGGSGLELVYLFGVK